MNKIIFLDFDGVITTIKSKWKLDSDKIDLLGKIINETGAKIVISSSWRRCNLYETKEYLTTINHYVPFAFPYVDLIIGQTKHIWFSNIDGFEKLRIPRGVEIDLWINENKEKIDNYVILDDDSDMLYCQKDSFVHTNTYKGLSINDVQKAIKILNK